MTDLPQRLANLVQQLLIGYVEDDVQAAETCREALEVLKRLPRDANGAIYVNGDVLRLTTDPTIRAVAVMCLAPLSDDGCVSYCTLAGTWAKVDSTEQAACRAAKGE